MTAADAKVLAQALSSSTTSPRGESAKSFPASLQALSLDTNNFGSDGAAAFAPILPSLPKLRMLSLGSNGIGDEGCEWLESFLPFCTRLEYLYLASNGVGDAGAAALAAALPSCSAIRTLVLNNNLIDKAGVCALLDVIPRSKALQEVQLKDNRLSEADIPVLRASMAPSLRLVLRLDDWEPEPGSEPEGSSPSADGVGEEMEDPLAPSVVPYTDDEPMPTLRAEVMAASQGETAQDVALVSSDRTSPASSPPPKAPRPKKPPRLSTISQAEGTVEPPADATAARSAFPAPPVQTSPRASMLAPSAPLVSMEESSNLNVSPPPAPSPRSSPRGEVQETKSSQLALAST